MTTRFVYNGHTYLLSTAGTWVSAQAEAKSLGGNLVTINDKAENDWLISTFGKSGHLWIGYTDQETEGTFKWINGENSTYTNWSKGEPNGDSKGNDYYVVTNWINSGYWNDCPTDFTKVAGIIEITPITFLPQRTFKPGDYPLSIINADLNNDGILDLAASNVGGGISVLLGLGDGNFNKSVTYTVGRNPRNITFADFNKDGKIDLINTNHDDNNVSLLLGNGDGTFKKQINFLVGKSPASITTADFNNDGNPDVITINNVNTNNISLLLGDGKSGFFTQKYFSAGTTSSPTLLPNIVTSDLNNDGNADLITAIGNNISVLLGNGKASFSSPIISSNGTMASTSNLVTGDFNNDSYMDLATSNANNSISVLYGKGNGSFSLSTIFDASYTTINAGDFNNDGNLDLLTENLGSKSASVYLGDGNGEFGVATSFNVGEQPESSTLGDFNNDGKIDIAITNWATSDISVLVNSTVMPAYTVTKSDGSLVAWGERFLGNSITNKIPDVKKTYSNSANTAFAMLKNDGSVITIGSKKGDIEQTGNQMDIAISGNGFLQVKMPDGTFGYTRDGQLKLDINGQVVTSNGLPIYPDISFPQDAIMVTIGSDGVVSILQPNNIKPFNVGQIQLAIFSDNTKLEKITGYGIEIYQSTKSSGLPLVSIPGKNNAGSIIQNSLEVPNVGGDSSDVKMQVNGDIDVKDIFSNQYAFAALRTDGSVVSWGDTWNGGDSSSVKSQLDGTIDVNKIYSNDSSFAAIRVDGSVVTWGAASDGGDSSKVKSQLDGKNDVVKIYSTTHMNPDLYYLGNSDFVALRADGSAVTWGIINTGVQLDVEINGVGFLQVQMPDGTIAYTRDGQLKLDSDGRITTASGFPITPVIYMGIGVNNINIGSNGDVNLEMAGTSSPIAVGRIMLATFKKPESLISIGQNLFKESTNTGSATVISPGDEGVGTIKQGALSVIDCYNEILNSELNGNNDIKEIYSTTSAHAALRVDGSVVTWGDKYRGGDSSSVASKLNGNVDVVKIVSNDSAFAALRSDGEVVTWGNGLQYSGLQGNIEYSKNPLNIAINGRGFLEVLMPDGTVAYTRDGHLKIDQNGKIVTIDNLPLTPVLTVPADAENLTIGIDGTVSVVESGTPTPWVIGKIETADFINPLNLKSIGNNLYIETPNSGPGVFGKYAGYSAYGSSSSIIQNSLETNINSGGDSSWVSKQLNGDIDVKEIYPNDILGFVALRVDNSLVMWGAEQLELDNISKIYSNSSGAFAALSDDGKVVTWGSYHNGGNSSLVTKELNGDIPVVDIQASDFAFAALRSDGSVITWGNASNGGDSTTVANAINSGVVSFEKENHLPTGKVEISGTVKEKEILVATNSLGDLDGLGDFNYQWLADSMEILNANSPSYTLSTSDIGKKISVSIDYIDGEGNNEIKVSAETGAVISAFSLKPSTGNDQVIGTSKNEKIDTLSGDDSIDGLAGNDTLIGGTGNDTLIGGLGKDNLTGGLGADLFKYNSTVESGITTSTQDTITDFKHTDNDKIDLSLIDANTTLTGIQKFNFINNSAFSKTNAAGQLRFDSTSHVLYGSTNSDNKAEFSILLSGLKTLVVDDLLL